MRSFCIALCLLTTSVAGRLVAQTTTDAPSTIIDGGQHAKKGAPPLDVLQPAKETSQLEGKKIEVIHGGREKSNVGSSIEEEFEDGKDAEGLIYNVDYHGVTTHPSPSPKPKHPKP